MYIRMFVYIYVCVCVCVWFSVIWRRRFNFKCYITSTKMGRYLWM